MLRHLQHAESFGVDNRHTRGTSCNYRYDPNADSPRLWIHFIFNLGGEEGLSSDVRAYEQVLRKFHPDVVINLIAISAPVACEKNETMADRVNVPTALLQALATHSPNCFLVHLSTDQIYDGDSGAPHTETAEPRPINACVRTCIWPWSWRPVLSSRKSIFVSLCVHYRYARSKVAAERVVKGWPWHVILRSSAIYGPRPPRVCGRSGSFLQFATSLVQGDQVRLCL